MIPPSTDEFINLRSEDAFKANEDKHPMSYKTVFALAYKTAEADMQVKLQQKLIDLIATEETGLSPEQLDKLKKGIESSGIPKKTFKQKVVEIGRAKIVTGETIPVVVMPKIIV